MSNRVDLVKQTQTERQTSVTMKIIFHHFYVSSSSVTTLLQLCFCSVVALSRDLAEFSTFGVKIWISVQHFFNAAEILDKKFD